MLLRCDLIAELCCCSVRAISGRVLPLTNWLNVYQWQDGERRTLCSFEDYQCLFQNKTKKWNKTRKPWEDKGNKRFSKCYIYVITILARPILTFLSDMSRSKTAVGEYRFKSKVFHQFSLMLTLVLLVWGLPLVVCITQPLTLTQTILYNFLTLTLFLN